MNNAPTTFLDIEPLVHDLNPYGDYGLLSMAFSPQYETNHLFYVLYTGVDGALHLDEFSANRKEADPASRREVLTINHPPTQYHYGGQLQFGPDAKNPFAKGLRSRRVHGAREGRLHGRLRRDLELRPSQTRGASRLTV